MCIHTRHSTKRDESNNSQLNVGADAATGPALCHERDQTSSQTRSWAKAIVSARAAWSSPRHPIVAIPIARSAGLEDRSDRPRDARFRRGVGGSSLGARFFGLVSGVDESTEGDGIVDRVAMSVVIEVREDVLAGGVPLPQPVCPPC